MSIYFPVRLLRVPPRLLKGMGYSHVLDGWLAIILRGPGDQKSYYNVFLYMWKRLTLL